MQVPAGWATGVDEQGQWADEPRTRSRFRVLPSRRYQIGLSRAELDAARQIGSASMTVAEMTPVVERDVSTVMVAELPVSVAMAREFGVTGCGEQDNVPAMLSRAEAVDIATRTGCRLPFEVEWESMCRAGTNSLFPWGWTLPPDDALDAWLRWDMAQGARNQWGFGGLFFGEWCADEFRASHASDAPTVAGAWVIKGGGAQFWPWQDTEWIWCMPAMRMPSTGLFDDGRCAARLVRDF